MQDNRAALLVHARAAIMRGSKSFATASRLFDKVTRERVWLLYAWCRACDDLADDQDHGGALGAAAGDADRFEVIRSLTAAAFTGQPTGHPSFDCLGQVARECALTPSMAEDVIAGFALDAADWRPQSEADMLRYCFHVAGAVGVMMAAVMGVSADDDDTLDRACHLGIAFQLANIARDVAEDAAAGRCYLPEQWLAECGIAPAEILASQHRQAVAGLVQRLCTMEREYAASARIGAARLAFRQRWAVLSAGGIYGAIARKVECLGAAALDQRVSTSAAAKLGFIAQALVRAALPVSVQQPPGSSLPILSRSVLSGRG